MDLFLFAFFVFNYIHMEQNGGKVDTFTIETPASILKTDPNYMDGTTATNSWFTGKTGPKNIQLPIGTKMTFTSSALKPGEGFKICLVPVEMVESIKPGGKTTSSDTLFQGSGYIEGTSGKEDQANVWLAPVGEQCAWSFSSLTREGSNFLGKGDSLILPTADTPLTFVHDRYPVLHPIQAQTCFNKHDKGYYSFQINNQSEQRHIDAPATAASRLPAGNEFNARYN